MKKCLYLSFLLAILTAASCKKSSTTPTPNPDKAASTQLETQLEAGQGTWKMGEPADTLYDASNKVVFTLNASSSGYWVFKADQYGPADSEYNCYQWGNINDPGTIYVFSYHFSFDGNKKYLVAGGIKSEIKTLTPTRLIILQPSGDLNYPNGPSSSAKADHGTITMVFTKYK